jgi:16S rRNA (uracil1498-N3)-methyltransferase
MRLHRFYVLQPLGEEVVIDDVSILKQWTKVFRYQKGAFVILFNGEGDDLTYCIESLSPQESVLSRVKLEPSYMPTVHVTLYLSILKKDNFELAAQKATELGVSTIVPIISARSEKKGLNEERLQKITVEASEQCGRGDIPTIMPVVTLAQVFEVPLLGNPTYVLHKGGISITDTKIQDALARATHVGLFIGPEGGWSEEEELFFKEKGIEAVSIGQTVLRAETAAIVACARVLQ